MGARSEPEETKCSKILKNIYTPELQIQDTSALSFVPIVPT